MSTSLIYTPVDEIPQIHQSLKQAFTAGKSRDIQWRKRQILQLWHLVEDNFDLLRKALYDDLGRAPDESDGTELNSLLLEIKQAYDNVGKWTQTEKAPWHYMWFAMSPATRIEPKGVVLLITPFNFPLYLILAPFAAVIAAGNACLLKPSEGAPACSSLLAELFPKYMDQEFFRVVNGAIPETTKLLELQWDHITHVLNTGNSTVAKIVCTAAAQNLTPVTLENAAVIDPGVSNLKVAAKRLMWGKLTNAGQICMSPDYAIVPEHFQDTFVEACKQAYYEMHPKDPRETGNMARIVNDRHAKRVKRLLDDTKGEVVLGGSIDMETKFCEATIVKNVKVDDILMSEEIFAPILPVVPVKDVDEAIKVINSLGNALVLHVFSSDSAFKKKVFDNTQSGLAIANETLLHIQTVGIPFGGVGQSGYGATTGKAAFDQFVHRRGTIDSPFWLDTMMLYTRYPPYTKRNKTMLDMFMHPKPPA
ncbi:NAD-dependent aldehyde dehydrogenase [Daedalea quercina L-15889]|uniref:Aldehyde dehydrogenase n=1 Tax=Daedalea quercina L-15889 TaxID=1314783 RepID=A0A165T830_9APHY|nr:NAD-dependent aldehyde dehydrogenase [Daedalea quercina L-15889]